MTLDQLLQLLRDDGVRIMEGTEQTERSVRIEWRDTTAFLPKPAHGECYSKAELNIIMDILSHSTDGELTLGTHTRTFNGDPVCH